MTKSSSDGELLALLDTLFESAPIGLAFVDRDFRYVRINPWLAAINGRSVADHVGRTVSDMQPGIAPRVLATYRQVFESGEPVIEQAIDGPDRRNPSVRRSFLASHFPVRGGDGNMVGVGVVVQEISAQKRAQAEADNERERLRTLFMQAPAAIALLRGPDHVYELSNPTNNLGMGKDPTGLPLREAFPEIVQQRYGELLDRVYQGGERFEDKEARIEIGTGDALREAFINGFYEPMRGPTGDIEGVMVFGFDVTEQVLARRRAELAEKEARAAVRVRDEFMSIAGHELRTPLTALQLHLQNLQLELERAAAGPGVLERFHKATAQIRRLDRLVAELLDVSRISAGRLDLRGETVDLSVLARDVVERLADVADRARCRVTLEAEGPAVGVWDRSRVEQVVTNILSNALKYGAGHPVEVQVVARGVCVYLKVRDYGIGIDDEAQKRVFDRFERAAPEQHYGGLGVGLWIAREIVQAHGGHIRLHSQVGRGTTVEVELPARDHIRSGA